MRNLLLPGLVLVLVCLAACSTKGPEFQDLINQKMSQKNYLAYNLWFERADRLYCVNYKKGGIIPAGTEITKIDIAAKRSNRYISFETASPVRKFTIHWNPKYHGGNDVKGFVDSLFTNKSFSELTSGLTGREINAIKKGTLFNGMSKKAVLVSYGYPPENTTFNIAGDDWVYYRDRFRNISVNFKDKKVVSFTR